MLKWRLAVPFVALLFAPDLALAVESAEIPHTPDPCAAIHTIPPV